MPAPAGHPERLASIRVSAFEIADPERVAEIEEIEEWHWGETDADRDKISRDFWYLFVKAVSEKQVEEVPDLPGASDEDLRRALEATDFESRRDGGVVDPARVLERIHRADRKKDVLLYGVTRGLRPQFLQECVVAAGEEVASRRREQGRDFTIYYRVERIESDRLHMEISEDSGDAGGRFSAGAEGQAYPYPFHIPILRSQSSFHGATASYRLEFVEVRPLASAAKVNTCRSGQVGEAPAP
jgi:hypothetical protein